MTCRVGMSSNPRARIGYWRRQCPGRFKAWILASGLTYREALAMERAVARKCGPACIQEPGGRPVSGAVYSIYRVDCN